MAAAGARLRLLTAPGPGYHSALDEAMDGATSVSLITAFATAAGLDMLVAPLDRVLARPGGQARLTVAVDRQGFNTEPVFRALLTLRERYAPRLSVGLVPQELGLLHAKALLAQGPNRCCLIVGSANLTQGAFIRNFELGIAIEDPPSDLVWTFRRFEASLEARSLDDASAPAILNSLGLLESSRPARPTHTGDVHGSWRELVHAIQRQAQLPPLPDEPAALLGRWVSRGYLVGRGRRGTDALIVRVPLEALERRGLATTTRRRSLGGAARESRTIGYQVELLPAAHSEAIRRDSRRAAQLLGRLSLVLPCFGWWMPETYWDVFVGARQLLVESPSLNPARIHAAAVEQRTMLLEGGGLAADLELILDRMVADEVVAAGRRDDVRAYLLPELHGRITRRTPDLIAEAIQFRTARQRWSPFEATDVPHRQLMVDVVQAVLAPTLRTGEWPSRFHSFAARDLARAFERKLEEAGEHADGATAQLLLEQARTWEWHEREFAEVLDEFRAIVPLDHEFEPPDVEDLLRHIDDKENKDAS